MEVLENTGMTDLQFKSWLKQLIRELEDAKKEGTKEETKGLQLVQGGNPYFFSF